ncbi:MAG TPA: (deoxy)nucleoside triphosphate pyrophosphohydrolase [Gemmatimonadota bacterium]|nr:(deoxy)nucleoside triphosphate pyrophosphohydrolase [Gemmatimonadota bacterium]
MVGEIVIGVVARADGRFLVQPRAGDAAMEGLWELPGGKVAPGEDHAAALAREIAEETGLTVRVGEPVLKWCHAYDDRRVELHAYVCEPADGERAPRGTRWVSPAEYGAMPMPEANAALLAAIDSDSSKSYQ